MMIYFERGISPTVTAAPAGGVNLGGRETCVLWETVEQVGNSLALVEHIIKQGAYAFVVESVDLAYNLRTGWAGLYDLKFAAISPCGARARSAS